MLHYQKMRRHLELYHDRLDRISAPPFAVELARRIREFTDSRAEDAWLLAAWERCGKEA